MSIDERIISGHDWSRILDAVCSARKSLQEDRTLLVAVAGVPGSGKTTLSRILIDKLNAVDANYAATCVSMDGYHMYRSELSAMPNSEEAFLRRGAEWTFDAKKLLHDLHAIQVTGAVSAPSFDHALKDPVEKDVHVTPRNKIVVMEGLYLCYRGTPEWEAIFNCFHVHVFIQCNLDITTERLAKRHMRAWGISYEEAMQRAAGSDFINAQLVATTASNAEVLCESVPLAELSQTL